MRHTKNGNNWPYSLKEEVKNVKLHDEHARRWTKTNCTR